MTKCCNQKLFAVLYGHRGSLRRFLEQAPALSSLARIFDKE